MKNIKRTHSLVQQYFSATVLLFVVLLYCLLTGSFALAEKDIQQGSRVRQVTLTAHLASHDASGNTVREVLESVGLFEKINQQLLAYLGVSVEATVDYNTSLSVHEKWEDSNLLWLITTDENDVHHKCAFDIKTGRLERALAFLYPDMNLPNDVDDNELEAMIIPKEEVLSIAKRVVALAALDIEIKPEKLEFKPQILTWHYADIPEYYGIRSQSRIGIGVQAVTGKVRAFSLYNCHLPPPEKTKAVLEAKDALDIAGLWGKNNNFVVRPETVFLTYARGSNLWSGQRDIDSYIVEHKFRLCWSVALVSAEHPDRLNESVIVFVDACTGEIVGGMDPRL